MRPQAEAPRRRPARGLVATNLQRLLHRRREFRRAAQRDVAPRIQAVEMRDVAMMDVLRLHVPILQPFLQLPRAPDLIRREPGARDGKLLAQVCVHAEGFRRLDRVREQVAQDLHVHRRPGADGGTERMLVLRRQRGIRHQPFVIRLLDERIEEKLRRALERGIKLFQLRRVAAELVAIPEVQAQPRAAHRPHAPRGTVNRRGRAPQVRVVMRHPAARAVLRLRGARAGHGEIIHHREQRLDALGEIARLGGPVIHLRVDVDGVFAAPRRACAVVPQPLQARRLTTGPRRADEQVTAKLIIQRRELRVVALGKMFDALVRRQLQRLAPAKIKRNAAEQCLMLGKVCRLELGERFFGRRCDPLFDHALGIAAHVVVIFVARGDRDEQRDFVRVGNGNLRPAPHPVPLPIGWGEGGRRPGEGLVATLRNHFDPRLIFERALDAAGFAAHAAHDQRVATLGRNHRRHG